MKEIKACVFCKYCDYEPEKAYSEQTVEGESYNCRKGHFILKDTDEMMEGQIYKIALECEDYDLKDSIKAYLKSRG